MVSFSANCGIKNNNTVHHCRYQPSRMLPRFLLSIRWTGLPRQPHRCCLEVSSFLSYYCPVLGLQCSELFTGPVSGGSVGKHPGISPGFPVSSWAIFLFIGPHGRETQPCHSHVHHSPFVLALLILLKTLTSTSKGAGMTENYIYALLHRVQSCLGR